ncbi:MAG TPA: AtpZ/AtpI family protein [Candidatus Saccharimonadales bacterium]|nr:AtpZ/AtpI family protein [Candidatus Saccharimonadales bacterium]
MTETKTPETTPSPAPVTNGSQVTVGKPENPQSVFVAMALDMSWRLAIAVLVPIIGGFELDSHIGTTPLLTVVGFIIAMIGFGLVLWRTSQVANSLPVSKPVSVTPNSNSQEKQS